MDQSQGGDQSQYYLAELSTRLRDVEETTKIIKEKTHVLTRNFVDLKKTSDDDLKLLKQKVVKIEEDIERIKSVTNFLIKETGKYVKKDELISIERLLKDFQPLEFVRMKDLDEIIIQKINKQKNINSKNK